MKILHPTDFSSTADKALGLARDLALRLGASLHVLHIAAQEDASERNPLVKSYLDQLGPELRQRLEEARKDEVKALEARLAALAGDEATSELRWGEPLRELLALSREYDLVVMGAHGESRFDEYFLGGLAGRFVRRSFTPVLTVRDEAPQTTVRRLLVATDFGEASAGAWRFARKLAEHGLQLVLTHVMDRREATSEVVARLERLVAGTSARHVLRQGDPVKLLPKIADEVGADAIVIGVRRHRSAVGLVFGSRADALLRSSPVPVLSVPYVER
jgi:nucleotide-binding universal stress UspA family protein